MSEAHYVALYYNQDVTNSTHTHRSMWEIIWGSYPPQLPC